LSVSGGSSEGDERESATEFWLRGWVPRTRALQQESPQRPVQKHSGFVNTWGQLPSARQTARIARNRTLLHSP
jgi:hypothetical protein